MRGPGPRPPSDAQQHLADAGSHRRTALRAHRQAEALLEIREGQTARRHALQDSGAAFDFKWTAAASLRAVLELYGLAARGPRIEELLARVGLEAELGARRPHELSGGQKQRLALARVLPLDPELLVLDEPLSALDVVAALELLDLLSALARGGSGWC